MNKLRVFSFFLTSLVITGLLSSCDSDDITGDGAYGSVSLSVQADPSYISTKANPEDIKEYTVEILQADKVIKIYSYDKLPEKLQLEPGTYTARASWGSLKAAAFESLYIEGKKDFTVVANKSTQVSLTCTPANAKVTVDYSSEVNYAYTDYFVTMSTASTGYSPLTFYKGENRAGYFKVKEGGEKLNMEMYFYVGSTEYPFTSSTTIKPRDFVRFHVKMDPNSLVPSIMVNPGYYYVGTNGGSRDLTVYCNQAEWTVSYTADWLEVIEWDSYVTLNVYPNYTEGTRTATLTFKTSSGDKSATTNVFVVQESALKPDAKISVTPPYLAPKPEGENGLEVLVTCDDANWTISNSNNWIKTEKQGDKVIFDVEPNDTKAVRTGSVEVKTVSNGKESVATVFVFQEVQGNTQPETYPLSVTVHINDEFIKEEVLEYVLDPADESLNPPLLQPSGFEHGKLITVKQGQAPAGLRVNIRAMGKIKNCVWNNTFGSAFDLTEANPALAAEGLQWDQNMKGEKLTTIYLDKFVNNLSPGSYSYNVEVTDETGKSALITLTILITL